MTEEKNNLELWSKVSETDAAYAKSQKVGGHTFTSINPQSQIKEATKIFGPWGVGFGIVPGSEKTEQINLSQPDAPYILLQYTAKAFVKIEGKKVYSSISACEALHYKTKNGFLQYDNHCRRKCETNAMSKFLSKYGFNADVYLKEFNHDDQQTLRAIEENKQSAFELKQIEKEEKSQSYREEGLKWFDKIMESLDVTEINHNKDLFFLWLRRARIEHNDVDLFNGIEQACGKAYKERRTNIEEQSKNK